MHSEPHPSAITTGPIGQDLATPGPDYLVIPRQLVDAMGAEWQAALSALFSELSDALPATPQPDRYAVEPCVELPLGDLDEAQRQALGITSGTGCVKPGHVHCLDDSCELGLIYRDVPGHELPGSMLVLAPVLDCAPAYGEAPPQPSVPPEHLALLQPLREARDVAGYLNTLVAAIRDSAATTRADPRVSAAILQLAPNLRALLNEWQSLAELADDL